MDQNTQDSGRGRRVFMAGVGALGVTATVASWIARQPGPPQGPPLLVDLAAIDAGEVRHFEWQGRQVCVLHRTPQQIKDLVADHPELRDPGSLISLQPDACRNPQRSQRPAWFVAVAECTHQGCTPQLRGDSGRFVCPCHASSYDLAGRVFRAGPAPANLTIPEHHFDGDTRLIVGRA